MTARVDTTIRKSLDLDLTLEKSLDFHNTILGDPNVGTIELMGTFPPRLVRLQHAVHIASKLKYTS